MNKSTYYRILVSLCLCILFAGIAEAQFENTWMNVGTLHNWYTEAGCEYEEGWLKYQQYGMRWPAIYDYQDMQAQKGMWIGCKNWTDAGGAPYDYKVVHVGPRTEGFDEFYPMTFDMKSKWAAPFVTVDGGVTFREFVEIDEVDTDMKPDRMLVNVCNTSIGVTMTRKIMQFSHPFHDNYHIIEYTFENTGNVDDDPEIELPNQTVEDAVFFYQYRWSVCRETRYVIGNGTGWGLQTMLDSRGDGVKVDPPDEQFRAQFAWHGNFVPFTTYDNVGGPIWDPSNSEGYVNAADTVGRLGASQFVGVVTLHAPNSVADPTDDPAQPSTTGYIHSDHVITLTNNQFDRVQMQTEYEWMTRGHMAPRHADVVEPDGDYAKPNTTADPSLGTAGGFSAMNGYGPYTLGPGESVTIVVAEAASGLNREACIDIGKQFKDGTIDARTKNEWVLTGRDSLFQTFRRAIANYESGYDLAASLPPPATFSVEGGGDRVSLNWTVDDIPGLQGFDVYRAQGLLDSTYHLIAELDADARGYDDMDLERGVAYYYYVSAVGEAIPADAVLNIPVSWNVSNRFYTQTYDPTNLKRPAGDNMDDIRIVPNPYNLSADPSNLLFPGEPNKIAFFNIPGQCDIKIYTELGELVTTIEHRNGTGDDYWSCTTDSKQIVVSGIYIAVFENLDTGETKIEKFVIIR